MRQPTSERIDIRTTDPRFIEYLTCGAAGGPNLDSTGPIVTFHDDEPVMDVDAVAVWPMDLIYTKQFLHRIENRKKAYTYDDIDALFEPRAP